MGFREDSRPFRRPILKRGGKMIRIAVVEDEKEYQEKLDIYMKQFEKESGQSFQVTFFKDGLDFVLKPITYAQFSMKLKKALVLLKKKEERYLMLPIEERKVRVSTDDILFIEVKNHNLHIVTRSMTYVMRSSMQQIERELTDCHFVRCNNSYLVNLKNVTGVQKDTVIVGEYELPVSRPKKKQFLKALSDYLGTGYL